jgi:hypothetical protein
MSSLVNAILFLALVLTSICVVTMYFKLKRLDAYHAEYKRIFEQTSVALGSASEAVKSFNAEGRELLGALGVRIEEARTLLSELEAAGQSSNEPRGTQRSGRAVR